MGVPKGAGMRPKLFLVEADLQSVNKKDEPWGEGGGAQLLSGPGEERF